MKSLINMLLQRKLEGKLEVTRRRRRRRSKHLLVERKEREGTGN